MLTSEQSQQLIREAIVEHLTLLQQEYVHWLNALRQLDPAGSEATEGGGEATPPGADNIIEFKPRPGRAGKGRAAIAPRPARRQ